MRLYLNLSDQINLKRRDKHVALSNLCIYCACKNLKSHTKIINLKYQLQHGMKSLNYLLDHILYKIFKIILRLSLTFKIVFKKHETVINYPSIMI